MKKGSGNPGSSASKSMTNYAYASPKSTVAEKTTVGQGSYENKSRVTYSDKQTGTYGRATATEKASTGNFQWQNGKSGTRNEYKETSTVRVGDKSGYTEVYSEQRVRNVNFNNNNNNNNSGSKSVVSYDNAHGGSGYGHGYGYGYGYDSD